MIASGARRIESFTFVGGRGARVDLELPFLHAIAENPDDAAAHLIFADWLEQNGEAARASFIREECEGNQASTKRFPWKKEREYRDEPGWLREGKAAWLAKLPALEGNPWVFRLGIPTGVSYADDSGKNRTHPTGLPSGPIQTVATGPVTKLIRDVSRVFSIPSVQEITLDCKVIQRTDIDWREDLGPISDAEIQVLANMRELEQVTALHLNNADLSLSQWHKLLSSPHLTGVSLLDLEGSPLSDETISVMIGPPLGRQLKVLCLAGAGFSYYDPGYGGEWGDMVRTIRSTSVALLAAASSLAGLQILDLSGNKLGKSEMEVLLASPYLSRNLRLVIHPGFVDQKLDPDDLRRLCTRFLEVK